GSNQSGDVSTALAQPLVVQVFEGGARAVQGVPITWAATGGGTVAPPSGTTDADGKATATWTLAPGVGTQVATATSAQVTGAAASFVANNGSTISGTVAINSSQSPFSPSLSVAPARGSRAIAPSAASPGPLYSPDRIVVGFRDQTLGVDRAASMAYRSMPVARAAATKIQQRVTSLIGRLPLSHAEVSPALLAARLRVDDPSRLDEMMASLRQDPSVAYVERDAYARVPRRRGRSISSAESMFAARTADLSVLGPARSLASAFGAATNVPNDPNLPLQYWNYNMIGLPKAWAITTGSASVTVAVLDMGVRFDDAGIAGNLSTDGYDFVSQIASSVGTLKLCTGDSVTTIDGDADGPDPDPTDPDDLEQDPSTGCWAHSTAGDHGLWTAGIIGELGNNAAGGTGINWAVKIRAIRVLGITGEGTAFDISQGILYAAGLPAVGAAGAMVQAPSKSPIINMSLGGYGSSTTEQNAIAAAVAAGSLIVASAGNDAVDLPAYPASYPGVMAVASVGPDGNISSFSNGGTTISLGAPGGEPRLDFDQSDTGGDWIWGRWWDFTRNRAVFTAAVGTSASAPHVAGVAALVLAQNPTLTAAALRQRLEQFATRAPGATRNNNIGWGVVNAYNSLVQQSGPATQTYVRLVDATSGTVSKTTKVNANGTFTLTQLATGAFYVQAGDDESADATIGVPGRRFAWAGGSGAPTVFNITPNAGTQAAAILLGIPTEVEPNDDVAHANLLSVGGYVTATIVAPDVRDVYAVTIPAAGTYTFQTSGVVGTCGFGLELDTFMSVSSATGTAVGNNDDFKTLTGPFCSRVQAALTPGIFYVTISGSTATGFTSHGRYRLEVRAGN
ncbi:MAG TPA: S8 family serine peptidase, partial [Gemmatimonadaceae bacterium]|nr:S8 family serine peptidase [Gemmatimonadaceae bacterium]